MKNADNTMFKQRHKHSVAFSLGVAQVAQVVCFSALVLSASEPALAQLEEVVVTARRRSESLQDTPISVSAVSGDALDAAGISNIADVKNIVPNLQIATTAAKSQSIFVRGIGQRAATPELDPGVGQYLNGIFIARQDSQLLDAVDVSNIQVLRGPQGTLFGKNNTGGAMLVSTREPHFDNFDGSVGIKFGNFGRQDVKLGLNIPLIEDEMGVRISSSFKRFEGFSENVGDGSMFGDEDRQAISARLVWQPNEDISWDVFAFWSKQDENGQGNNCELINPNAAVALFIVQNELDTYGDRCNAQRDLAKDGKVAINTSDSKFRQQSQMYAINLKWALGALELESISAFSRQYELRKQEDIDATDLSYVHNGDGHAYDYLLASGVDIDPEERVQMSQEIKFNGAFFNDTLDLTFGAFFSIENIDQFPNDQVVGVNGFLGIPPEFLAMGGVPGLTLADLGGSVGADSIIPLLSAAGNFTNIENETRALFVQGSWDMTETWQLTLGVRYTEDDKFRDLTVFGADFVAFGLREGLVHGQGGIYNPVSRAQFDAVNSSLPVPLLDPVLFIEEEAFSQLTPSFTLTYNASDAVLEQIRLDSLLVYFTASQGYKSGGIGLRGQTLNVFEPEIVDNTEIGFKIDAYESRVRLNGAIYRMDYDQIQVQQAEQGPGGPTDVRVFLDNAGVAVVQGAELESTFAFGELTINANLGYTDAYYTNYIAQLVDGSTFDRSDEPFAIVPEHNRSFAITYRWQTDVGMIVPRFHYYYASGVFIGLDATANEFEGSNLGAIETYNTRLTWIPSESIRVAAFVNNIKDTLDYGGGVSLGDNLGSATKARTPPRTFGIEFNYSWGQ